MIRSIIRSERAKKQETQQEQEKMNGGLSHYLECIKSANIGKRGVRLRVEEEKREPLKKKEKKKEKNFGRVFPPVTSLSPPGLSLITRGSSNQPSQNKKNEFLRRTSHTGKSKKKEKKEGKGVF
jgi:hypothetical protein